MGYDYGIAPDAPSDRDWVEDFSYENGQYQNMCIVCAHTFTGHKRRNVCKRCHSRDHDARAEPVTNLKAAVGDMSTYIYEITKVMKTQDHTTIPPGATRIVRADGAEAYARCECCRIPLFRGDCVVRYEDGVYVCQKCEGER